MGEVKGSTGWFAGGSICVVSVTNMVGVSWGEVSALRMLVVMASIYEMMR